MKNEIAIPLSVIGGGIAGLVGGYAGKEYAILSAQSDIAVRPALKHVTWWQAMFSGHYDSWLIYHNPQVANIIGVIAGIIVGFIAFILIYSMLSD